MLQYIALSKLRAISVVSINTLTTCLRGMDIKKCVFLTVNVFRREFFIRPAFRLLAMPLWA